MRRSWAVAASVYLLAVLHRTSLGVASLQAQARFHITPAQLAVFVFLQIGVYAAMQVPTGVLVDRYGPKRVLVVAAVVAGAAQLAFAAVPSYPSALLARALLGFGDALTFVSVLRFTALHFNVRRYALLVSLTSTLGTVGNVAATLPLALALRHVGWGVTFATAGSLSLAAAVGVVLVVPGGGAAGHEHVASTRATARRVALAWRIPGTRLAFWLHFACMSSTTAFAVLWGVPYLVNGVGLSTAQAGAVLMAGVVFAALCTPVFGSATGRRPALRVPLAFACCVATAIALGGLVLLGDHPPRLLVIVLFVLMTLGGPAAMTAFAVVRDYNTAQTLGTASGLVNAGGFVATIAIVLGFGWTLDAFGGTNPHSLRLAVLVAVAVQAIGTVRLAVWWRRSRAGVLRRMASGEPVPVPIERRRWDLATPVAVLEAPSARSA